MPTGYTAALYEGKDVTLREFALTCARAFGALIMLRDDPFDAPLPDSFAPSSYAATARDQAAVRVTELEEMDDDACRAAADRDYVEALGAYRKAEADRAARKARYEAMLDQVLAWSPPTPDHQGLHAFMVTQLEESISFDTGYAYPTPTRKSPQEWRAAALAHARRDLDRNTSEHEAEVQRAATRTAWLNALRESLPAAEVDHA